MNRLKMVLLAIAVMSAGLCAFNTKTVQFDTFYFRDASGIFVIETGEEGVTFDCPTLVNVNCLYTAIVANPRPDHPEDYAVVPGYANKRHRILTP